MVNGYNWRKVNYGNDYISCNNGSCFFHWIMATCVDVQEN